jgi:uncharacterized protein YndB with AHSA1/START domain
MSEPKFVYVTYIATTPEKLWQALTDGAFTEQYWFGTRVESDWTLGAKVRFRSNGSVSDYGEVLECNPYTRLSYSWHVKFHEAFSGERPSRVVFEIEPMSVKGCAEVKLTVTHEDFDPGSKVLAAVSNGWPVILASLKSLLETGTALAATSAEAAKAAKEKAIALAESEAA